MNAQDVTEIRTLTSAEMEDVSGAFKMDIGPVRIKIFEDGLILSVAVKGVGSLNLDEGGFWVG